jgi:hypothetical protein
VRHDLADALPSGEQYYCVFHIHAGEMMPRPRGFAKAPANVRIPRRNLPARPASQAA